MQTRHGNLVAASFADSEPCRGLLGRISVLGPRPPRAWIIVNWLSLARGSGDRVSDAFNPDSLQQLDHTC
eukprot:10330079-Alexandrium_andersonii.AAC.1